MKVFFGNPATREEINNRFERFFIKAGSRWPWSYNRVKDEHFKTGGYPFPFYLAYSANVLIAKGYEVTACDGVALNLSDDEFLSRVEQEKPDIFIFETSMHAFRYDMRLVERIKKLYKNTITIVVGPHPTGYAKELLKEFDQIDFAIRGEYEFAVLELLDCLKAKEDFKLRNIKGIAFREKNETIFVHDEKAYINEINDLPMPWFKGFPEPKNNMLDIYGDGINTYKPAITLHSTRGCPYKCNFCLWVQVMYDNKKYRRFDPKRVVDEMEYVVKEYGAKEIYFDEDNFCVHKKHVISLCEEIKNRNLNIKWSCMGDAMTADEDMIKAMSEAGCIYMKFGVESGNKEILKKIGKPLDPDRAVLVSEWCWKYGIMTHATFMFGLTGETMKTMEETLDLANKIKFDYAQASIATPFPGTRMYQEAVEKGEIDLHEKNENFDGTQSSVMRYSNNLKSEDVVNFRKKAIRSMIFNKLKNLTWWKHAIKHNIIKLKYHGLSRVLSPIRAYLNL